MNFQTVRLVSTFGSGSCVSSFGSSPKVETAAVSSFGLAQKWKLRMRFQFWAVSTFGPAQVSSFKDLFLGEGGGDLMPCSNCNQK